MAIGMTGWRLRHTQSFFSVMPHIMKRRSDSSVLFDDVVEIEELEKYVRRLRRNENMPDSRCSICLSRRASA